MYMYVYVYMYVYMYMCMYMYIHICIRICICTYMLRLLTLVLGVTGPAQDTHVPAHTPLPALSSYLNARLVKHENHKQHMCESTYLERLKTAYIALNISQVCLFPNNIP